MTTGTLTLKSTPSIRFACIVAKAKMLDDLGIKSLSTKKLQTKLAALVPYKDRLSIDDLNKLSTCLSDGTHDSISAATALASKMIRIAKGA